jgi:biotin carboxylase
VPLDAEPHEVARTARYPCVLKPIAMSGSRGVIRADDPAAFVRAFLRIAAIVRGGSADALIVEDWIPGAEVSLEGLLDAGRLAVLALFDKPEPLDGPTFEETIFVTPSRHPSAVQSAVARETEAACRALGLSEGPIHAELRLPEEGPTILEIAPRTIGGLCSRALRFGTGTSLEELVLRHALGLGTEGLSRETQAAGVMMLPIPRGGRLAEIRGLESARAVPLVEEVTIQLHRGAEVVPLPEGHRYLGFIFARGPRPAEVEEALRTAHSRLQIDIL